MKIRNIPRGVAVATAIFAVVPIGRTVDSDAHVATPLCPKIQNARTLVTVDGFEVVAPTSAEERSEAVTMLTSFDRDQRLRSAISLALAGDVAAFRTILESRDSANLSTYGRFYLHPNRLQCIDHEIERAITTHLGEPELRKAFTAFFETNLYQSRDLFDRWIDIDFEEGRPHDFNRVVMATLATRLEGIEGEVLARAKRALDHDTPARKYALPAVHRRWVEFFGERGYAAAIPYMEDLLLAEGYEETRDNIVAEFSQTRSKVYLTLNELDSPEAANVFVRQLDRVVRSCPPRFVLYELGAFGSFAVSHAASDEHRRHISDSLAALLGLPSPTDPTPSAGVTDYSTHKKIVELLAELGTTEASAVLVADLRRLTRLDNPRLADSLIVSTLGGLRALPDSAELDVPALLVAAAGLPDHFRLHYVPSILDNHPDPAAHAFYLEQVEWIAANWDGFEHRFQMDPAKALDAVIPRLMAYDEPEQLTLTRNALDGLYLAGRLDERRYIAGSAELNDALGDESALYLEVQERRRVARQQEAQQEIDANAAEWGEIVAHNTSPEGIRANVDSLGIRGGQARLAASWLVIAGAEALDPAHRALADPESSDESRIALLQVLGEIGDPRSVAPVIDFTQRNAGNRTSLRAGLGALALVPPSDVTFDFAGRLLEAESPALSKQQALVYLASIREPLAAKIARTFAAPAHEPEVRIPALLLGARLGDRNLRPTIVEMLLTTEDRSYRDVLMRALAELSSVEEFEAFGDAHPDLRDSSSYRDLRGLVTLRSGENDLRIEAARDLIASGHPWDRRDAVRFLVEEDHGEVLLRSLQHGPPSQVPLLRSILNLPHGVEVFAQIRRMGYEIEETPEGLALVRRRGPR